MDNKIYILGAGAIGCALGGQLLSAGRDVTFIGRKWMRDEISAAGGLILSHFERATINAESTAIAFETGPDALVKADTIIVCVKSKDTARAATDIAAHANRNALIISFQNGVSNAAEIQKHLPRHIVLGAMVPFNVAQLHRGHFHIGTEGDLFIESSADERAADLISAFTDAGQTIHSAPNIHAVLWGKLLLNLNNAMNALHGSTLKSGLWQRDYRKALAAMIKEALEVLMSADIPPAQIGKAPPKTMLRLLRLPNFIYRPLMNRVLHIDEKARSSMLDDLEAGRPSEIPYLQGEIIALAKQQNQAAPINAAIAGAVNAAFATGKSPCLNGAQIWSIVKEARRAGGAEPGQ